MPYVFPSGLENQLFELVQAVIDPFPSTSLNHWLLNLHARQQSQMHTFTQKQLEDVIKPNSITLASSKLWNVEFGREPASSC